MMIVISYDVNTKDRDGQKRLRKVAKICESKGCRVQNSVFEVLVDPGELVALKGQLAEVIDEEKDSVRFYRLGSNWKGRIEFMGKETKFEQDGVIIL